MKYWRSILCICCKEDLKSEETKTDAAAERGQRVSNVDSSSDQASLPQLPESDHLHSFSYAELSSISQDFAASNFLGEGGFGPVYRGRIDHGLRPGLPPQPVAIKLLNLEGTHGHREWETEVVIFGQLKHAHLVKLIGYCCEEKHRLLVYEYIPNGSLETHLFKKQYLIPFPWATRMKIALGAAKGLAFLQEADKAVIYRDFKASNVLLDPDFTAKLSDLGLARHGPEGNNTHVSTRKLGTYGYAAPEYISTGIVYLYLRTSCDVYSFGVVLLELLTGQCAGEMSRQRKNLVEWARPALKKPKKLRIIMDRKLKGNYSKMGPQEVAALARRCLSIKHKERPTMSEVAAILEPLEDLKDIASPEFVYIVPTENVINQ